MESMSPSHCAVKRPFLYIWRVCLKTSLASFVFLWRFAMQWSRHQQHQHPLGMCWECRTSGLTHLLSQQQPRLCAHWSWRTFPYGGLTFVATLFPNMYMPPSLSFLLTPLSAPSSEDFPDLLWKAMWSFALYLLTPLYLSSSQLSPLKSSVDFCSSHLPANSFQAGTSNPQPCRQWLGYKCLITI